MLVRKMSMGIVGLCWLMAMSAPNLVAGTVNMSQTGQTQCWDASGNSISCTGTGQDGDKKAGSAWLSLRFMNNGDGTISDQTGLIWLKNANCFGRVTWANALAYSNNLATGQCGLTDGSQPGDWRLPNIDELLSLPNYQQSNVFSWLNNQGFTNAQPDFYWSSTTDFGSTNNAMWVNMADGYCYTNGKASNLYVWPVRGGQ